jgi:holo-[acyl-carrier protein] synthase
MIVGVGFDLEDIADFGRTLSQSGEAFLNRVYTKREVAYCQSQPHSGQSYAVRYAAKEAAMKALGIAGMEGLKWRDFEVVATAGAPHLRLRGVAAAVAKRLQVRRLFISLSHSRSTAGAVVIAEAPAAVSGSGIAPSKSSATTKVVKSASLNKRRARS